MKTVYVVGGDSLVEEMFQNRGWATITTPQELKYHPVDLVCFTGGADVNPKVYGEEPNGARHWNDERDAEELAVYEKFKGDIPMVGICRGGQLLNVLNGGTMIQHLGETVSGYVMMDFDIFDYIEVHVDHHQGMEVGPYEELLGFYANNIYLPDYVIWYPKTKCLCFQPHPEWGHKGTEELFFELIEEYIV